MFCSRKQYFNPRRATIRQRTRRRLGGRFHRRIANLTRRDGEEFLALAPKAGVRTEVETFRLEQANDALQRLRNGEIRGAAVLVMS